MAGSGMQLQQSIGVQVVRASPLVNGDFLKKPIICKFCKNKRLWLIRCESCGSTEERICLEEDNAK